MFVQEVHDDGIAPASAGSSLPSRTADSLQDIAAGGRASLSGKAKCLSVSGARGKVCDPTNSLGSSPSGGSGAENWFNSCNSNVQNTHRAKFIDNDPPYYVNRRHRCGPQPPNYTNSRAPPGEPVTAGDGTIDGGMSGLSVRNIREDGSEAFRSVIDDLTIENKELKRRLRKLETLHCSHLEEEKLFEIKMHGLPLNKKRELEGLLRGFATDLGRSPDERKCPPAPQESPEKVSSDDPSPTSDPRLRDSASASHSTSGRNSGAAHLLRSHFNHSTSPRTKDQKLSAHVGGTAGRVHVRHAPSVFERAKMKPIVKKLEQLFTGRTAAGQEQPPREQLVSESAARTGEELKQTLGEGLREACIYSADAEASIGPRDNLWSPTLPCLENPETGQSSISSVIPCVNNIQEQRPTRPLDLDPNRPQYPAENIDYIRHLGACSPKQHLHTPNQQDEGWVYLNVLTNMAQLHTINVTPEFVRKAITNLSDKLELSADGRKIRWKGGNEGTSLTSDSGGISGSDSPDERPSVGGDGAKRRKLGHGLYERRPVGGSYLSPILVSKKRRKHHFGLIRNAGPEQQMTLRYPFKDDKFDYRPLFFHWDPGDEDGGYSSTANSNPACSSQVASTSSFQSSPQDDSCRSLKRERDDGPIIFFNGADFCTDLSRDGSGFSSSYSSPLSVSHDAYTRDENGVLGCSRPPVARTASGSTNFSHPVTESRLVSSVEEVSDASSDRVLADNIAALSNFKISPRRSASDDEQVIPSIELEASGIGGVQPSDNFAINVSFTVTGNKSSCLGTHSSTSSSRVHNIISRILETPATKLKTHSPRANSGLAGEIFDPPIRYDVISATRVDLPPFQLPPPTYFFHSSSSSECYSSDSNECGALVMNSSSQSSYNQQSSPTESAGDCANSRMEIPSSINFIHPRRIVNANTVAGTVAKLEGNFETEKVGVGSPISTAEGSDGSGYESGDDDIP